MLRKAVRINSLTELALTKLDVLDTFDEVKVCTSYDAAGEPVYAVLPGWRTDISSVTTVDGLPAEARSFIELVEREVGIPIRIVGTGADRSNTFNISSCTMFVAAAGAFADLTVTAPAGTTLAALQACLARHQQWLPLEAEDPERATIGGLLAALSIATAGMQTWLGDAGTYAVATLAGFVDVDAVTLTLAHGAVSDGLEPLTAARGIVIAALVNTGVKAGIAATLGGRAMARSATAILVAALIGGAVTALLTLS